MNIWAVSSIGAILNNATMNIHISLVFFIWLSSSHLSRLRSSDNSFELASLIFREVTNPTYLLPPFLLIIVTLHFDWVLSMAAVNFPKAEHLPSFSDLPW